MEKLSCVINIVIGIFDDSGDIHSDIFDDKIEYLQLLSPIIITPKKIDQFGIRFDQRLLNIRSKFDHLDLLLTTNNLCKNWKLFLNVKC